MKNSPADGLIGGIGTVNAAQFGAERARTMVLAYDYTVFAGTQGGMGHKKLDRMVALAAQWQLPIVLFAEGGGGRPNDTDMPLVAGLDTPSSGSVTLAGQSLTGLGEDALARLRGRTLGFVFQSFHLIPTLTAEENVAVPLELRGDRDARTRARALLATVGLAERGHHLPGQLSGGEQQRVALARAFVVEPAVLLADEPTGSLDFATGAKVMELMFDMNREAGTTLVLVTHDRGIAARCDRQLHIEAGRLVEPQVA